MHIIGAGWKLDQSRFHIRHYPRPHAPARPAAFAGGPKFITAAEATHLLRVEPQTLYAYHLRSLRLDPLGRQLDDKRRLYHPEDVAADLRHDARTRADVRKRLASMEKAGQRIPGFNLPLYPTSDPRAGYQLELATLLESHSTRAQRISAFIEEAEERPGLRPSIEVAPAALAAALAVPERGAGALWALGRAAGWSAHVIEQRFAGFVLRPRARYGGAPPEPGHSPRRKPGI